LPAAPEINRSSNSKTNSITIQPEEPQGIRRCCMTRAKRGGGWAAVRYTLRMANRVGWLRLWKALRAKNACKTCAFGMGGQRGGMTNEHGHWPEVCKKSLQALVADMQKGLTAEFFARCSLDQLRTLSPRELEWCGRLRQPVFAGPGDTHYRPIGWDQALGFVADQMKAGGPDQTFFYASGRTSNEAGFLLQLFARLFGTNCVNNCSYYCHQASGVGLSHAIGTGTATITLDDAEQADLFFLIGGNPASNHPRLMRTLMNIRRRKGHVIVINPVKEPGLVNFAVPSDIRSLLFGTKIASLYVQPHIGGDMALLLGLAKIILDRHAAHEDFIASHTEGWAAYASQIQAADWQTIERSSGLGRSVVEQIADYYLRAKNVVFGWTMGITQHEHGVANVQAIVNVALLRGMVGRRGAGLLPIRGHSNVQGIGSVGVVPNLKQGVLDALEGHLQVELPRSAGLDTMGCMEAAGRGQMRTALCLGGNLFGSNPDAKFASSALARLESIVYINTALNTGHAWGRAQHTLILPALPRDEELQKTTQESMFNFVRLSDGGPARLHGPRGEVDIVASLAARVLGAASPVNWQQLKDHCSVRRMIAENTPGYENVGNLDESKQEFHVGGRILHDPRFATPSGKARFTVNPLPDPGTGDGMLRLMTVRSEGQFNTVVYEEEDVYRGQERRDVILMNRADINRLGLHVNDRVTVRSQTGAMSPVLVREFDIRAGNVLMYYPEANVLVPRHTDPQSRTPAFKSVAVAIEPEGMLPAEPVPPEDGRLHLAVVKDS
jgi:molybdopterin-dependent oxidoreductase alpha subunit